MAIKIGILGDIGSGKSYVARQFGYPVFSADKEVKFIYKKNKNCFKKLRKILPKFIKSFPISKKELSKAIIDNKTFVIVCLDPDIDKMPIKNIFDFKYEDFELVGYEAHPHIKGKVAI